jgi:hypothetical protein
VHRKCSLKVCYLVVVFGDGDIYNECWNGQGKWEAKLKRILLTIGWSRRW